ncbi:MAG: NAD(P)-dependent oxidoreductase [Alphaproteobacteria bacterium]|nr:NAD(P)-dependent oxidoreductase [Alphaproteobacteria bacterium]
MSAAGTPSADGAGASSRESSAIGFIGLGRMGRPMAGHIAARGHRVVIHDTNPAACIGFDAATVAASPKEVADRCGIVFSCVATTEGYDDVALGPQGLCAGTAVRTYVHLGTTGAAHIRGLAAALARVGIETLDAPISGGVVGAVNGKLASMVSGPADALARARPLIDCYSRVVFDFGRKPGTAQVAKIINNNISTTNLVAAIEGLTLGIKAGIDSAQLADLIAAGTGSSLANDAMVRQHVVTRDFTWGSTMQIILKDLCAWQELADELKVGCPINRAASDLFVAAITRLGFDEDITAVAKFIEQNEGVSIGSAARHSARSRLLTP